MGYTCQACNFNFLNSYGELGTYFIEAHHLVPYSQLGEGQVKKLDINKDFAVLCSNCHSMIHRMKNSSDIENLKKVIEERK